MRRKRSCCQKTLQGIEFYSETIVLSHRGTLLHQWRLTLDFQIRSVWKCSGQDFYDEVNFAAYSGFLCALWDFRLELGLKRVSDVFRFSLIINRRRNSALNADLIEFGPNLL